MQCSDAYGIFVALDNGMLNEFLFSGATGFRNCGRLGRLERAGKLVKPTAA